jgi:hypothetical protein
MRLLGILIVVGLLGGASLSGASVVQRPRITVTDTAPFVVHGSGFLARERVTVTVSSRNAVKRAVVAGIAGSFTVKVRGVELGECNAYFVSAHGRRGSYAVRKVVPECNPLQPVDG